jgi:hypothetical protein
MKRQRPVLVLLALLTSGSALVLARGATTPDPPVSGGAASKPSVPPNGLASSTPAVELDPHTRGWTMGNRYTYRMKLSTTVAFDETGNGFDFDVVGQLELEPVAVSPESVTLYATIPDARLVSRIPGAQAELDKLAAELRSSGAFFVENGGRTEELRVAPSTSQMAASTYRQVASALQFARARDGSQRYTAEESDTTGRYVAEYALDSDGSWQKRKLRYLGLLGNDRLPIDAARRVMPEVLESRGRVGVLADGRPRRIDLLDRMQVKGAQSPVRSTVVVELEAKGEPKPVPPRAFGTLLASSKRFGANEPIAEPGADRALDVAKIGELDFETILARIEARESEKGPGPTPASDEPRSAEEQAKAEQRLRDEARLFNALGATFRTEPRTIDRAVARIRAKSPAAVALMDALGSAATPEAHRGLGKLLGHVDAETERRIVLALARSPHPTSEGTRALMSVLDRVPLHTGALYGLGTYSRLLRDQGSLEESKAIGEFLVARLKITTGDSTISTVLKAIANSGYAGALSRVKPYLRDQRELVRAAAVRALQSMQDARVDGIIAERLTSDESPKVRLSALEAAEIRGPGLELAEALSETINAEDRHVRYRAVELMADWLPRRPELRATLALVAKGDTEVRIRERAQSAL